MPQPFAYWLLFHTSFPVPLSSSLQMLHPSKPGTEDPEVSGGLPIRFPGQFHCNGADGSSVLQPDRTGLFWDRNHTVFGGMLYFMIMPAYAFGTIILIQMEYD